MKLSIIMPVYNTESYLKRALDSIIYQNLDKKDFELILINDGSSDGSELIVAEYAKLYKNITLINQPNGGEASARNRGLEIAKGKYITFVDCDDAIYENTFLAVISYLEKHDLDVLYLNIQAFNQNGFFIKNTDQVGKEDLILNGFEHPRRPFPATVYRRELIADLKFPLNILIGTDSIFNAKVQSFAKRVSYLDLPYYQYTVRENSLSKQWKSQKAFEGFVLAVKDLRQFENTNFPNNHEAKNYFDKVYEIFVTRILELSILPDLNREKYVKLTELLKSEDLTYILDQFQAKYPYVNQSFFKFVAFQKYLYLKSKIHRIIDKDA